MHPVRDLAGLDPRHTFLDATDVIQRYGWGKTKGYQNLKDHTLVPPPVVTHPDRWRLDQLLAWEEKGMALAEADLQDLIAPRRGAPTMRDLLPPAQAATAVRVTEAIGTVGDQPGSRIEPLGDACASNSADRRTTNTS